MESPLWFVAPVALAIVETTSHEVPAGKLRKPHLAFGGKSESPNFGSSLFPHIFHRKRPTLKKGGPFAKSSLEEICPATQHRITSLMA
jgi:hypothetical protein